MEQFTAVADHVMALYYSHGNEIYFGENVTQLQHALQCAQCAMHEGEDEETILAAFLHDVGHIHPDAHFFEAMEGYGIFNHENLGAEFLRELGFSDKLCTLVASHVSAKRYLTYKFPEYYHQLSDASKKTLQFQGGKMTTKEAKIFELSPLKEAIIRLRKWDELAKEEEKINEDTSLIREMMIRHLAQQ